MHARELLELGARIAVAAKADLPAAGGCWQQSVRTYWTTSRCRVDRWKSVLAQHADLLAENGARSRAAWRQMVPHLEEVFAGELLARLVSAAAAARDAARKEHELEPIARSILTRHLELRAKILHLFLIGERLDVPEARQLNDLRRKLERWTDMLLAHFAPLGCLRDIAFEPNRMQDFADDLGEDRSLDEPEFACKLVLTSLRGSFRGHFTAGSPNFDLNGQIGHSLRGVFGLDAGAGESGWLARIDRAADEAQQMLDEIIALDPM